jgi:hypothetical protein
VRLLEWPSVEFSENRPEIASDSDSLCGRLPNHGGAVPLPVVNSGKANILGDANGDEAMRGSGLEQRAVTDIDGDAAPAPVPSLLLFPLRAALVTCVIFAFILSGDISGDDSSDPVPEPEPAFSPRLIADVIRTGLGG